MSAPSIAILADRAVLAVSGPDARDFLQGLVSNDVTQADTGRAVYAALLTAQGKFLFDFFIAAIDGGYALDCAAARRDDLAKRLKLYRLRAKVELAPRDDLAVCAIWNTGACDLAGAFPDPRLADAGFRAILPASEAARHANTDAASYEAHRLSLGLPDGARDLEADKSILLEAGFEELHGVDFSKGCYMGQELTARTKYRGLVKKRLIPVAIEGAAPAPGTKIVLDGKDAGEMRSALGAAGMALVRLDALERARIDGLPLMAGDAALAPWLPDWLKLPEKADDEVAEPA